MGEIRSQFKEQQENPALQEKGNLVLREFTRVVNTFNRALHYKETQRFSLIDKINGLKEYIAENSKKLQTINRNIEIYDQNTLKIATTLENFRQREELIKRQFELLLQGSQFSGIVTGSSDVSTSVTRDSLIKRRKEYLDGLDNVFKQLEGELSTIEGIRKEMENARVEISIKKEEALESKDLLENSNSRFSSEVKALETSLENSVKEERKLIKEFGQMMGDTEKRIELGQEIDHILFSILAAGEAGDKRSVQLNDDSNGNCSA